MIEAAGGVVVRDGPEGSEVLVVHRTQRDDWSLPKGKVDPRESPRSAAVREVEEETGVRAVIDHELPSTRYQVDGVPKRVRWYRMRPIDGDPARRAPDHEVDEAAWWPVARARTALTYPHDRTLLDGILDAR